jgi:hypothetical protein
MKLLCYGLQRSGTNYLEELLKRHYQVSLLNSNADRRAPIQKHFRLYDQKEIVPEPQYWNDLYIANFAEFEQLLTPPADYYLVISKDPYSWLLSYEKWAKTCDWAPVNHHYIQEYNLFYGKWLEFAAQTDKIIFIRYIDLLQDTQSGLSFLAKKMGLKKKFFSQFQGFRIARVDQSAEFTKGQYNYYLNRLYMQNYTPDKLVAVNRLLDRQVLSQLGYELEQLGSALPEQELKS